MRESDLQKVRELVRAGWLFRKLLQDELQALGLSVEKWDILEALHTQPLRQVELTDLVKQSAPAVSERISTLVDLGLAERRQSVDPARTPRVWITDSGREQVKLARKRVRTALRSAKVKLNGREDRLFANIFQLLPGGYGSTIHDGRTYAHSRGRGRGR